MTQGRKICNTLKDIRKRIAAANGIDYHPSECTHKGECSGSCPRCEQELSDLTKEIRRRRRLGMAASVAGLAVGIGSLASCHIIRPHVSGKMVRGDVMYVPDSTTKVATTSDTLVLNPQQTDVKP